MNVRFVTRLLVMLLVVAILFGALFGAQWFFNRMMVDAIANMPVPPVAVQSAVAERLDWPNEIRASGTLVAVNGVDVTTEVGGKVTALHFESGAHVEQGELLLELDPATERADLANLQAQARLADLEQQRQQRLFELESVSRSALDQAAARADSARAQVAAAQARIDQKLIRAPFSGELGLRAVDLGEFVAAGTEIVSLQALDPIFVDFSVPEQQLASVQTGLQVRVTSDAFPGEVFAGEIIAIAPRIDVATRNVSVRARLANEAGRLRPGGYADVRVQLPGQRRVVAVPRTAVSYNPYGNTVYVIGEAGEGDGEGDGAAGGQRSVTSRFVETGAAMGDYVEIVEGVQPGDELATSGLFRLRNGSVVVVDNQGAPEPQFRPEVDEG